MVRKIYEGYDYIDPDNLYTYPHSSVLINKFNEKNDNKARELEYRLVASQSLKLFINPIEVNTVSDILKIHKFLFEGMYTWAGQYRQVNISKREVIRSLALMKGYECEISIGLDDDIYHLYMDGTVYGDTSKLEKLFNKLLTEI